MKSCAVALSSIASAMFYLLTVWSASKAASLMLPAFGMLSACSFTVACIFAGVAIAIAYEN